MASDIVDNYEKLKLTAEEEEIVEFEEEVDEEKAKQIALSLIGKLRTTNYFNLKSARGLVIKELDWNLCIIQFFSKADRDFVLNERPWVFDGNTLLFKKLIEVVFKTLRYWVKVHDVLGIKRTKAFVECFANAIGSFVTVHNGNVIGVDMSLNFVADININKPLRRGARDKMNEQPVWFDIKYVQLSECCYGCGKLGHTYKWCDFDKAMLESALPCGPKLWASPIKSTRRGWEAEKQEECKLYNDFGETKKREKPKDQISL
ncbi:hypothetical protein Cgig2_011873 [Carnegiea gigantea]|uniref:CCHC-type domain-containing protein n=1 Tax=Carnegiea gigantea TaxID=171969 RepID=A0A9Q1QFJ7_9CARY|nr:hypothetical protein Cgig2_011873 [Carnegiea gigantea]